MESYEKEIEVYLERLRKISLWQRNVIVPLLLVIASIQIYNFYYTHWWFDGLNIAAYLAGAIYNHYDARRTFAKIMFQKLVGV